MVRVGLQTSLVFCLLVYRVASIELLANYKYWKSISNTLTYDYSGNSRHGGLFDSYIFTDRGISPNTFYFPSIMSYNNPRLADYTFSFWMLSNAISEQAWICIYSDSGTKIEFYYMFNTNSFILEFRLNSVPQPSKTTSFPIFEGWNLHTVRAYLDSNTLSTVYAHFYSNLVPIHSSFLDLGVSISRFNVLHFGNQELLIDSLLILYELWIHTGSLNISELSDLMSIYECQSSLNSVCLSTYPETMNKFGERCPDSCTSMGLSCESSLNCIPRSKNECQYGLYDLETSECLFYCPSNSCICPGTIYDPFINQSAFSCSCIIGYNKISDDPPACISKRCLTVQKVGYNYKCSTTESGYTLDASGNCCICKSGFTQTPTKPELCINESVCINYTISGGDYTCSSCAEGYLIDADYKCNKCDLDYVNVLANPFTCIAKIENCSEHMFDGYTLMCKVCREGYSVDDNNMCNRCEDGYFEILRSPLTCILDINHCVSYEKDGEDWKCNECKEGYQLSISGLCDSCQLGYVKIESKNSICKKEIEHCIEYEINSEDSRCTLCTDGYGVGPDYQCSSCDAGYVYISLNPLTCGTEILHCISYDSTEDKLECLECESGYILMSECIPEIPFCIDYTIVQEQYLCVECQDGHELDDEKGCSKCAQGYTYSNYKCVPETFDDNQDQDSDIDYLEGEDISEVKRERGRIIESSNFITTTIVLTSTSISSIVSMESNTLILYINTIQLISYVQHLNIQLPYEIRKQQSSNNKIMKRINFLSNIKIQDQDLKEYIGFSLDDDYSFLANAIYQLITLWIIVAFNCIICSISRYRSGKVKEIASKLLRYFKYTLYIQFYMMMYLDITYYSLNKLMTVRYT